METRKRADVTGRMDIVLRFRIEMLDISPVIWRRIEVPGDYSFWDFHVAIQDAMGWTDSHLHSFEIEDARLGRVEIGIPDPDFDNHSIAGWKRKLSRHFRKPGDQLVYLYDFGDSWRHLVTLESLSLAETGLSYPRCIGGARKCPPEDCGGLSGFEEFLEIIADTTHEEHEATLEWCGGAFDPDGFDQRAIRFDDPAERLKDMLRG